MECCQLYFKTHFYLVHMDNKYSIMKMISFALAVTVQVADASDILAGFKWFRFVCDRASVTRSPDLQNCILMTNVAPTHQILPPGGWRLGAACSYFYPPCLSKRIAKTRSLRLWVVLLVWVMALRMPETGNKTPHSTRVLRQSWLSHSLSILILLLHFFWWKGKHRLYGK